ncbi:MAG: response regulator [Candidatus Abyssubacteria bacterium]|nr:response regulator [Candidatus Abyssubacteria bacterium]
MIANEMINVLLVDDEDRFRVTTAATLKRRGFQVTAVGSGLEAIEEVKKGLIDVVILDVKMPGMDGHMTLRDMRKIQPDVEVIMLTGYGGLSSALEGWHEGVFAYLTKPSSIDFLVQRIREAYCKKQDFSRKDRRVRDIMEPLSALISTVHEDQSVTEAVEAMYRFFDRAIGATKHKETLLRSILVTDRRKRVIGVIGIIDILRGLQPPCMRLSDDRPDTGDSLFLDSSDYVGNFSMMVRETAKTRIRDLMPCEPPTIDANADLMEATNRLLSLRVSSLLVMDGKKAVGVIRDSDIFLEMTYIIRERQAETEAS